MKRWAGLFGILALATLVAVVVSSSLRRKYEDYDHRIFRVRPGMTEEEALQIMERGFRPAVLTVDPRPGTLGYWEWRTGNSVAQRWTSIRIAFDEDRRVTRRTIDEKDMDASP